MNLSTILTEILSSPKAIFLAGPAGSGKTYISNKIIPINQFTTLNVDSSYEKLLKSSGIGTNIKDFQAKDLSTAAKLMAQARKLTQSEYEQLISSMQNIIIDGTGGSSGPILKKKQELEALGYKTFMLALYVSPIVSLERNKNRDRSLLPQVVVRSWRDYSKNIDIYRNAFGSNFALVNNDPDGANKTYDEVQIKKDYFDTAKFKGKDKTDAERKKEEDNFKGIVKDIEYLLTINRKFDSLANAKVKIQRFLK